MMKMFWFHIDMNDYRSGTHIYTFKNPPKYNKNVTEDDCSSEDDYATEEAVPYSFIIPENYRIYIISEFPDYKIIGYINCDEIQECKKLYLKMFSQIHNCLPFVVNDYNSSYKEIGFYPEIPEYIMKIPNIPLIDKIIEENTGDNIYFVFVIDKEGNEVFTDML